MSDNVVKFADAASRRVHLSKPEAERPRSRQSESVISKNFQLRQQRQKVWREAETATRYWLALMILMTRAVRATAGDQGEFCIQSGRART